MRMLQEGESEKSEKSNFAEMNEGGLWEVSGWGGVLARAGEARDRV